MDSMDSGAWSLLLTLKWLVIIHNYSGSWTHFSGSEGDSRCVVVVEGSLKIQVPVGQNQWDTILG